jgi:D-glycero-alpha-D-manno-heptose 1-phosphate guanylyltransferase
VKTPTAMILAGGLGLRLRPAVSDRPKVLADVAGRPFLAYLLDQLAGWGIERAVLCTGFLGDLVRSRFGASYRTVELRYSQETSPMGTAGALRLALPCVETHEIVVLNGDSFCKVDLDVFRRWHRAHEARASLALVGSAETARFGSVRVDAEGRVLEFLEKGGENTSGLISAGVYLVERPLLEALPPGRALSLERDVFPSWIGHGLFGFRTPGPFVDIGTPDSYALAGSVLAEGGLS